MSVLVRPVDGSQVTRSLSLPGSGFSGRVCPARSPGESSAGETPARVLRTHSRWRPRTRLGILAVAHSLPGDSTPGRETIAAYGSRHHVLPGPRLATGVVGRGRSSQPFLRAPGGVLKTPGLHIPHPPGLFRPDLPLGFASHPNPGSQAPAGHKRHRPMGPPPADSCQVKRPDNVPPGRSERPAGQHPAGCARLSQLGPPCRTLSVNNTRRRVLSMTRRPVSPLEKEPPFRALRSRALVSILDAQRAFDLTVKS